MDHLAVAKDILSSGDAPEKAHLVWSLELQLPVELVLLLGVVVWGHNFSWVRWRPPGDAAGEAPLRRALCRPGCPERGGGRANAPPSTDLWCFRLYHILLLRSEPSAVQGGSCILLLFLLPSPAAWVLHTALAAATSGHCTEAQTTGNGATRGGIGSRGLNLLPFLRHMARGSQPLASDGGRAGNLWLCGAAPVQALTEGPRSRGRSLAAAARPSDHWRVDVSLRLCQAARQQPLAREARRNPLQRSTEDPHWHCCRGRGAAWGS